MPDFKPTVKECAFHSEDAIRWVERTNYCADCGKFIETLLDEHAIKRTHDIGT